MIIFTRSDSFYGEYINNFGGHVIFIWNERHRSLDSSFGVDSWSHCTIISILSVRVTFGVMRTASFLTSYHMCIQIPDLVDRVFSSVPFFLMSSHLLS